MNLKQTVEFLESRLSGEVPSLMMVLGSGWGELIAEMMDIESHLSYSDIPGFPVSTVEGHAGHLISGRIAGTRLLAMQGRFHYYEGYSMAEVTFPIRVFRELGGRGLFLTNAAGGIDSRFQPGDLMLIKDHINLMGDNPLRGPNETRHGPRFPDMTAAWDAGLAGAVRMAARASSVDIKEGVYLAVSGPNFETPAEIRAFATLGASAVGMSTVPECLVARHAGMRVVGISCITNVAAHEGAAPLSHEEVGDVAAAARKRVSALIGAALPRIEETLNLNPDAP
jgi:purine-nucleoside phosphorylase